MKTAIRLGKHLATRKGRSILTNPAKCSFCEKAQWRVEKLIAGPGVHICGECIDLCNEMIGEQRSQGRDVTI